MHVEFTSSLTHTNIKEKTAALYLINTAPAGGAEQHMKIKLWRKRRVNAVEIAGREAWSKGQRRWADKAEE